MNPFYELPTLLVVAETQRIVINPATFDVQVVRSGPEGPAGPPGVDGAPVSYEFTQSTPASSWVINHNLGFKPNITIEEAGTGNGIIASEIHHTSNQVELQFNTPRAGSARLS